MIQQEKQAQKGSQFEFRPGQHDALEEIVRFLKSQRKSSYMHATGSFGKTVLYIKAVQEYRKLNPGSSRALVLADSVNLLRQLEREFRSFAPELSVERASRVNPFPDADVVFASIQRCRRLHDSQNLDRLLRPLIIVDEAHALLGKETQNVVAYMLTKGSRILGGTATDEYFSEKKLSGVLGEPCYTLTYKDALELKVVAPFTTAAISLPFDMSQVRKIGGEYDQAALAAVFPAQQCAEAITGYHRQYMPGRKGFVQCLSREHAKKTAAWLTKNGIKAAAITGDLPEAERERLIEKAKSGEFEILCGAKLLIQGIDWPEASVAYNFPSTSNLAVKQRGFRVTRLDPQNPDKCATIVEILPTTVARTRPPLIFREAVDGGILSKGVHSPERKRSRSSGGDLFRDESRFFPDEGAALAIIDQVLQGSGPWARLSRRMPSSERLQEVISTLHNSTQEFLEEFSAHKQFPEVIRTLALEAMRESRESETPPKLARRVEDAIRHLSGDEATAGTRSEALREVQRFLFGPAKYAASKDSVAALGLSAAHLSELLPRCFELDDVDLVAELVRLPQALQVIEALVTEVAEDLKLYSVQPTVPGKIVTALNKLSDDRCTPKQQDANAQTIAKFLFSGRQYTASTGLLKGLGFTVPSLKERLQDLIQPRIPEKMTASLAQMNEGVSFLTETFEPLIECQATLRGIKGARAFDDSDWYSRGAEALIRAISLHDGFATKRFQSYLQNQIAREFFYIQRQLQSSKRKWTESVVSYEDPRKLDSRLAHGASEEKRHRPESNIPADWPELIIDEVKSYASASTKEETRSRRLVLAQKYAEGIVAGKALNYSALGKHLGVTHQLIRQDIEKMRRRLERWVLQHQPSSDPQVLQDALAAQSEAPWLHLPSSKDRLSEWDVRRLFDLLRYSADPFSRRGEALRERGVIARQLGNELQEFVLGSKLPCAYKETLSVLIQHFARTSASDDAKNAVFNTEEFSRHGWRTAQDATECLAVLLLAGAQKHVDPGVLSEKLPFEVTYDHLFAVGLEPHPGRVILDFLRNKLRFNLVEYAKPETPREVTPLGLCNAASMRIPGGPTWVAGEPVTSYFLTESKGGLFGKTLAELRAEGSAAHLPTLWDPLFYSYLALELRELVGSETLKAAGSVMAYEILDKVEVFVWSSGRTRTLAQLLGWWFSQSIETLKKSNDSNTELTRLIERHESCPIRGGQIRAAGPLSLGNVRFGSEDQLDSTLFLTSLRALASRCFRYPRVQGHSV